MIHGSAAGMSTTVPGTPPVRTDRVHPEYPGALLQLPEVRFRECRGHRGHREVPPFREVLQFHAVRQFHAARQFHAVRQFRGVRQGPPAASAALQALLPESVIREACREAEVRQHPFRTTADRATAATAVLQAALQGLPATVPAPLPAAPLHMAEVLRATATAVRTAAAAHTTTAAAVPTADRLRATAGHPPDIPGHRAEAGVQYPAAGDSLSARPDIAAVRYSHYNQIQYSI